jgi:hypothetical protein
MFAGVGNMHKSGVYMPQPRCGLASDCWVRSSRARTLGMHVWCWCSWLEPRHHAFVSGLIRLLILLSHPPRGFDQLEAMDGASTKALVGYVHHWWWRHMWVPVPFLKVFPWKTSCLACWSASPPWPIFMLSQCGNCLCIRREVSLWSLLSSPSSIDSGLAT